MSTINELHEFIEQLRSQRKVENEAKKSEAKLQIEVALNEYLQKAFIEGHRPWRAVIGNKRCRPVPIHHGIKFYGEYFHCEVPRWPNMSEEFIREYLEELGFVLTESWICASVPAYKKGDQLSFAQKWVKKINQSYSIYCTQEKKKAIGMYSEFISELTLTPPEKIKFYDGYTLFEDFEFSKRISSKCAHFMKQMLKKDGIEICFDEHIYEGVIVRNH